MVAVVSMKEAFDVLCHQFLTSREEAHVERLFRQPLWNSSGRVHRSGGSVGCDRSDRHATQRRPPK